MTHAETCATGNGTTGPYTCTLQNTPVTPLTAQVGVGSALAAGDDGGGVELKAPTGTGNFRSSNVTQPLGSIPYSSGVSITFSSPVPSGTPITVTYQTNGWGQGHGLLDGVGPVPPAHYGNRAGSRPTPTGRRTARKTIQRDLGGFLFHFAKSYFATVKGDIEAAAPAALYIPVDPLGGGACPHTARYWRRGGWVRKYRYGVSVGLAWTHVIQLISL